MQTTSNELKRLPEVVRGAVALTVALLLAAWLWHVVEQVGAASAAGVPVRADEALSAVVASAALAGLCWLALSVLLELLSLLPGASGSGARRVADVLTPRMVRRAAGALLGVGIVAGLAPGASVAAPAVTAVVAAARPPLPDPGFAPLPDPGWAPAPEVPAGTAGGWVPSRPTVRAQPDVRVLSPSARSAGPAPPSEVVVRRGDCLWSIAARHLGPDASEAEVARAWPAWFDANRGVVGDDPDLLRPGQVLRPPPGPTS